MIALGLPTKRIPFHQRLACYMLGNSVLRFITGLVVSILAAFFTVFALTVCLCLDLILATLTSLMKKLNHDLTASNTKGCTNEPF